MMFSLLYYQELKCNNSAFLLITDQLRNSDDSYV